MKNFTKFTLVLIAGALLISFNPQKTKACVDFHPPQTQVIILIDSTLTNFCIRVINLHLFGGGPGAWCTCAISNFTDSLDIYFAAFMDSGTTNPVVGFAPWTRNFDSDSAWSNSGGGGTWNGFVAEVTSSGLLAGLAVDLLIYGKVPAGWTYNIADSSFSLINVGTDEWDPTATTLANTHNSISMLAPVGGIFYVATLTLDTSVTSTNYPDATDDVLTVFDTDPTTNIDVSANDSDVDGNLDATTVTVIGMLSNGGAAVADGFGGIDYTPGAVGTDSINYSICDAGGLCDSAQLKITVNLAPGIGSISQNRDLRVYPNPFSDQVNFTLIGKTEDMKLILYNSLGQTIKELQIAGTNSLVIRRDQLPEGIYTYQWTVGNNTYVGKLFVH